MQIKQVRLSYSKDVQKDVSLGIPFDVIKYSFYEKNDVTKGVITCKTMSVEKWAIIADSRPFFQ